MLKRAWLRPCWMVRMEPRFSLRYRPQICAPVDVMSTVKPFCSNSSPLASMPQMRTNSCCETRISLRIPIAKEHRRWKSSTCVVTAVMCSSVVHFGPQEQLLVTSVLLEGPAASLRKLGGRDRRESECAGAEIECPTQCAHLAEKADRRGSYRTDSTRA